MKLILEIDLDGAAFDFDGYDPQYFSSGDEAAKVLRQLAGWLDGTVIGSDNGERVIKADYLIDSNGNRCGSVRVES